MNYEALNTHINRLHRAQWKNALMTASMLQIFKGLEMNMSDEAKEAMETMQTRVINAADEYNESVGLILADLCEVLKENI